jgi:transposase-like protein
MRSRPRCSSTRSWSRSATGRVVNRPFYAAIGVMLDGERDILGLWAGTGGEGAKFSMSVLTDLHNRGVRDVFFVVCDGLKGLPEVVGNIWPQAIMQTCTIHLIRNTFRLASKKDWDAMKRAVKPISTAVNAAAARTAFEELAQTWEQRYPAIIKLWDNTWAEFIPFLDHTTWRSAKCCAAPTPSSRSTHATGGRSRPAATSRPSRPHSNTSTWRPHHQTPPARNEHDRPVR